MTEGMEYQFVRGKLINNPFNEALSWFAALPEEKQDDLRLFFLEVATEKYGSKQLCILLLRALREKHG